MALTLIEPAAQPGSGLHQEQLTDFILVRVDEVDEGERLRPVDPVRVQGLAATLLKDGQDTPVQVCRLPGSNRWTLVTGAHRRAAAELAGIEYLRAEIVTAERNARRLREIRENLFAPDLLPIDRAAFVAELVQIKRAQAGLETVAHRDASVKKAVRAEADGTLETISNVYGWTEQVGAELGFTGRTIRNDLLIYRGLPASLVERLRAARHPILANAAQLRALVKLAPAERDRVVEKLIGAVDGKGRPLTLPVARTLAGVGRAGSADNKHQNAIRGAWNRLTIAERRAFRFQKRLSGDPDTDDPAERALLWFCEEQNKELDADWLIGEGIDRFGGRWQAVGGGGHLLQIGRITVEWPEPGKALLLAWVRSAASAPPKRRAA